MGQTNSAILASFGVVAERGQLCEFSEKDVGVPQRTARAVGPSLCGAERSEEVPIGEEKRKTVNERGDKRSVPMDMRV